MSSKNSPQPPNRWRKTFIQRRVSANVDYLRPHRLNWSAIVKPLDDRLAHQADDLPWRTVRRLRYFWLDGLFAAISENFYLGFMTLFALAYGASNGQVGTMTAVANLLGALALFPGARLVERVGRRKPVVVWSGGGVARIMLLLLAMLPFLIMQPSLAILLIIVLNGVRAFMANLANPGWTALVADLVPDSIRGRYFGSRNTAMGVAALLVAPLAGRLIFLGNGWGDLPYFGYQIIFFLAFLFGMVSTFSFQRIEEPPATAEQRAVHHRGDLRRAIRQSPGFVGLVVSAFVWNMALQVAAPFFNVYLVNAFQSTATTIGLLASVSSLTALLGQRVFGRLLDVRGAFWVQIVTGFLIPGLPLAWVFITADWQVGLINTFGGFLWAGYNLANFNLLLTLTPDEQRPRAVALYQTAVFTSAVIGPLLGGFLADTVSYQLIFGLSAAGRFLGMVLFALFTVRLLRKQRAGGETAVN
ncbi:MAG: MFS transporter [Candidatus Promineifilaceae bacterium]|nr:MFS transporter [Anaerolineaceae bacterium]